MELIDQRTKKIMEECKEKARTAGLQLHGETLEYIVSNKELTELMAKMMIPTLYDYWVHDVEIIKDKWIYDAYPHNPYETVINTRPAISFYNDNNPDWLNIMIFYHVLGHIDFMQNNVFFKNTWDDDFCGQALADMRLLNRIREEMGEKKRWVDYVIEFAKGVDNLVGYYAELEEDNKEQTQEIFGKFSNKANFYFGEFLRYLYEKKEIEMKFYYDEIERYNACIEKFKPKQGEATFFDDWNFRSKFPEFPKVFEKRQKKQRKKQKSKSKDILQYLMEHSEFLDKEQNKWMKDVIGVVRKTSLYFQPQFRDRICNEGWASLWHERLFLADEKISGHEINYARLNAGIMVNPKTGFNPYAVGKMLFEFIEEMAKKGKLSYAFQMIKDSEDRKKYDKKTGEEYGKKILFEARRNFNDYLFVNFLSDEDFQDFVNKHKLFVAGQRFNPRKGVIEIYIKSRKGKDYRDMLNRFLYHPPYIVINEQKAEEGELYLDHIFEGRTLVTRYIPAVLKGLAYLWSGPIKLETTEFKVEKPKLAYQHSFWGVIKTNTEKKPETKRERVVYTVSDGVLNREVLGEN
jgi:stage V sporulation protein R